MTGIPVVHDSDLNAEVPCAFRLSTARFKVPKQLFVVNELPRNTMGKVQKNLLREQHKGLFAG